MRLSVYIQGSAEIPDDLVTAVISLFAFSKRPELEEIYFSKFGNFHQSFCVFSV